MGRFRFNLAKENGVMGRMTPEQLAEAGEQEYRDFIKGKKKLDDLTAGGLTVTKREYKKLVGELFAMRHKDEKGDVVREVIGKLREFLATIDAKLGL